MMTVTLIFVAVAFLALTFLLFLASAQKLDRSIVDNPAAHLRSVDLEAFRNLVDPEEEDFLRRRLDGREFRKLQRERLRAAIEYISGASHNAAVLLKVSEAASLSSDSGVLAAAEKLRDDATRLRLYALQATGRLYLAMVFPGARIYPLRVAESYEQMTRKVVMLGLRYPTKGIPAAL